MPVSVEGLQAIANLNATLGKTSQDNLTFGDRRAQAQQASDLFKQGDTKGAYSILMQDPDFAAKNGPAISQIVPDFAQQLADKKRTGELDAETEKNSNPAQLQELKNQGLTLKTGSKVHPVTLSDGTTAFISEADVNAGNTGNIKVPAGQTRSEIGADGQPVSLGKGQIKTLTSETDKFNQIVKPDIEAINSTVSSEDITKANVPGSKVAEKVNTLRGLYKNGRVPQQLIDQYMGSDAGLLTNAQDKLTEAEGQGLAPPLRQKIFQFNQALQQTLLQQYEAKLSHFSKQVSDNTGLDQAVVKRHFAGAGPTPVQQVNQQVQKLDPQLQAVFNKAHDDLFNPDPSAQAKAKAVMQIFQQKYGISY